MRTSQESIEELESSRRAATEEANLSDGEGSPLSLVGERRRVVSVPDFVAVQLSCVGNVVLDLDESRSRRSDGRD